MAVEFRTAARKLINTVTGKEAHERALDAYRATRRTAGQTGWNKHEPWSWADKIK